MKLPPYAPELNPTENIWQYLRANALANSVWETYEDIVEACCQAWNGLIAKPDVITSIGTRKWAQVKTRTAGIMHLMRALEVPLDALARSCGVEAKANWNKLLNDIEAKIRVKKGKATWVMRAWA